MTTYSPILQFPEVDANQTLKEATINTATLMLEAATQDTLSVDMSAGAVTLNATQWAQAVFYVLTGATGAVILSLPATKRFCTFSNTGAATVTVEVTGAPGSTLAIAAGKIILVYVDGTNVKPLSSGVTELSQLSDAIITTPTNGQILQYSSSSSAWENASVPGLGGTPNTYTNTDHTLGAGDVNNTALMSATGAQNLVIPLNATYAWPIGASVTITAAGAGAITIDPISGVTVQFPADMHPILRTQYSSASLLKLDTDTWLLVGDLLPV